jgi:hypothetical protein
MLAYKNYVAGWLDSTVHDFLSELSPSDPTTKYALITCLDSNPNPAALRDKSPELRTIAPKPTVVGAGLLIPVKQLLQTISQSQLFFGFDELWFFPSKSIAPKPPSVYLVGPGRIDRLRLRQLGKWMSDNNCSIGLGGGEGLNFVAPAQGIAKTLLGHSIEQPEPALSY